MVSNVVGAKGEQGNKVTSSGESGESGESGDQGYECRVVVRMTSSDESGKRLTVLRANSGVFMCMRCQDENCDPQ